MDIKTIRKVLKSMRRESPAYYKTAQMMTGISAKRFDEIVGGAEPTPVEEPLLGNAVKA